MPVLEEMNLNDLAGCEILAASTADALVVAQNFK